MPDYVDCAAELGAPDIEHEPSTSGPPQPTGCMSNALAERPFGQPCGPIQLRQPPLGLIDLEPRELPRRRKSPGARITQGRLPRTWWIHPDYVEVACQTRKHVMPRLKTGTPLVGNQSENAHLRALRPTHLVSSGRFRAAHYWLPSADHRVNVVAGVRRDTQSLALESGSREDGNSVPCVREFLVALQQTRSPARIGPVRSHTIFIGMELVLQTAGASPSLLGAPAFPENAAAEAKNRAILRSDRPTVPRARIRST